MDDEKARNDDHMHGDICIDTAQLISPTFVTYAPTQCNTTYILFATWPYENFLLFIIAVWNWRL